MNRLTIVVLMYIAEDGSSKAAVYTHKSQSGKEWGPLMAQIGLKY